MNDAAITNKENKKSIKRKKIIESAFQLFSRKSYHEVMMEDVARLSSIAKGTVYTYFSSKEVLYFSIMKLRMEKLTISLKENIKNEINCISSLHSFIVHLYMFMMKYQNFFLMYRKETLKTEHELCSELIEIEKDYRNILFEIIKSGKDEGLFRNINEDFAVELILGSIYGAVQRGIENDFSENQQRVEREIIFDFILNGLTKELNKNMHPLQGKIIVLTRSADQIQESAEKFINLGAQVISFPTLEIIPPESWQQFDEIIHSPVKIDFLIFTSANAVKMFFKRLEELGIDLNFSNIKVIAVGKKTAEVCRQNNIPVKIIPKDFSSAGILSELSSYDLNGKVIFMPRSAIGREELPAGLESLGAIVKTASVYNVGVPFYKDIKSYVEKLKSCKPDLFIFASPSAFENFISILNIADPQKYFADFTVAAIGPTTKEAIEKKQVKVDIDPSEYSLEGLLRTVIDYYTK
ncbi:MAG: uroporphyrinogen-III synthase [Ignavibacteria bacterium]